MSFLLIRNKRLFGDLHKIFAISPIYPEEKVKPPTFHWGETSAQGQRDKRIHYLLQKDKLSMRLKKFLYLVDENNVLLNEDSNYENLHKKKAGPYIPSRLQNLHSKIDPDTGFPYGMGFDNFIKDLKDKKLSEVSQDKMRDIWIHLGFFSTEQVLEHGQEIELGESAEKIRRKLFTNRHKITPSPYKNIYNERDPKSQVLDLDGEEFFSQSSDELKSSDCDLAALKKAKRKYKDKLLEEGDDAGISPIKEIQEKNNSEEESSQVDHDELFDQILPSKVYLNRYDLQKMNQVDSNMTIQNVRIAGYRAKKKMVQPKTPIFKFFDGRDFVKKTDLEHSVSQKYGKIPSFAEILVEAEEIINLKPVLKKVHLKDEYKKNVHFEPRYLDKEMATEDYFWSFMPRQSEAVFPGFITGKPSFRQEVDLMIKFDDIVKQHNNLDYRPNHTDLSRKALALMKHDPNNDHYLQNHIRFWQDDIKKKINIYGLEKDRKAVPTVPWEYIKVKAPKALKLKRNLETFTDEQGFVSGKGKRKTARATAFVKFGTGEVTVNGKSLIEYCPDLVSRDRIIRPLIVSKMVGYIDMKIQVHGGGFMGQSFAARQAVAKAVIKLVPEASSIICKEGMLVRDPRQVERKKTSKFKARKSYTYVKR